MTSKAVQDRIAHGVSSNSPLPPSVETAYYRKCIELKRRITEIESNNDDLRVKKQRIERSVMKMRIERGLLMEQIAMRMRENPDDSDESNSPPPTPQDRPLRSKRTHRKGTPPPGGPSGMAQSSPPAEPSTAGGPGLAAETPETSSRFRAYHPPGETPVPNSETPAPAPTTNGVELPPIRSALSSGQPPRGLGFVMNDSRQEGDENGDMDVDAQLAQHRHNRDFDRRVHAREQARPSTDDGTLRSSGDLARPIHSWQALPSIHDILGPELAGRHGRYLPQEHHRRQIQQTREDERTGPVTRHSGSLPSERADEGSANIPASTPIAHERLHRWLGEATLAHRDRSHDLEQQQQDQLRRLQPSYSRGPYEHWLRTRYHGGEGSQGPSQYQAESHERNFEEENAAYGLPIASSAHSNTHLVLPNPVALRRRPTHTQYTGAILASARAQPMFASGGTLAFEVNPQSPSQEPPRASPYHLPPDVHQMAPSRAAQMSAQLLAQMPTHLFPPAQLLLTVQPYPPPQRNMLSRFHHHQQPHPRSSSFSTHHQQPTTVQQSPPGSSQARATAQSAPSHVRPVSDASSSRMASQQDSQVNHAGPIVPVQPYQARYAAPGPNSQAAQKRITNPISSTKSARTVEPVDEDVDPRWWSYAPKLSGDEQAGEEYVERRNTFQSGGNKRRPDGSLARHDYGPKRAAGVGAIHPFKKEPQAEKNGKLKATERHKEPKDEKEEEEATASD